MRVFQSSVGAIAIACFMFGEAFAQEPPNSEAERVALKLLNVTGAGEIGTMVVTEMMGQLKLTQPDVPEEFWDTLATEMNVDELTARVIPIYTRHLTVEEMQAAVDFYKTPAGRKIIEKLPVIMQEAMGEGEKWVMESMPGILARLKEAGAAGPLMDKANQKETISEIRNVGTAFMSWLTDQVTGEGTEITHGDEQRSSWTIRKEGSDTVMSYSLLTHEKLSELLVPKYILEIPEKDGWGHPYQFALNDNLLASSVLGIRSPGRDGRFEGDDYVIGPFVSEEYDRDIVWNDGYFVRWPEVAPR